MSDDLTQLTAARLSALYRKGKASPVETLKAVLKRTERLNPVINAFRHIDDDAASKAARASERRWKKGEPLSPIDGVPVSIKELVRVNGWAASMGSKLTDKTWSRRMHRRSHACARRAPSYSPRAPARSTATRASPTRR